MKNIVSVLLLSTLLSACSITGPAEDKWDEEEKEDRISLGNIFGGNKKTTDKEKEELEARVERLEKEQYGETQTSQANHSTSEDITAPPVGSSYQQPTTSIEPGWQNSASYAEWKRARQTNSKDYQEFKEYKEWLEFQKLKNKKQ